LSIKDKDQEKKIAELRSEVNTKDEQVRNLEMQLKEAYEQQ